jgi:FkbM family methyltransferase
MTMFSSHKVLRTLIERIFSKFSIVLLKRSSLKSIHEQASQRIQDAGFRWTSPSVDPELRTFVFKNLHQSRSQLQQDLFVAYLASTQKGLVSVEGSRKSFFVEFGATDGIELSNTYLLESVFGWEGIVCEPARIWRDRLAKNRNCSIDYRCVYNETGHSVGFNETKIGALSTIDIFSSSDLHALTRARGHKYLVETVSLNDLLEANNAPHQIDYLSIDTEGSEFEILQAFDFEKWQIGIITVEHNFTEKRESIHSLLTKKGYKRVLENVSMFDDWYVADWYFQPSF